MDLLVPEKSGSFRLVSLDDITTKDMKNTRKWPMLNDSLITTELLKRRTRLVQLRIIPGKKNGRKYSLDTLDVPVKGGATSEVMLGEIADICENLEIVLKFLRSLSPKKLGKAGMRYLKFLEQRISGKIQPVTDPNSGTQIALSVKHNSRRSQSLAMIDHIFLWKDDKYLYFVLKHDKKLLQKTEGTFYNANDSKKDYWNSIMLAKRRPDRFYKELVEGKTGVEICRYDRIDYTPLMGTPSTEKGIWKILVKHLLKQDQKCIFFHVHRNMILGEPFDDEKPIFKLNYQIGVDSSPVT